MTIDEEIEAQAAIVKRCREAWYDAGDELKIQMDILNELWDKKLG